MAIAILFILTVLGGHQLPAVAGADDLPLAACGVAQRPCEPDNEDGSLLQVVSGGGSGGWLGDATETEMGRERDDDVESKDEPTREFEGGATKTAGPCQSLEGGNWQWVRHVPAGSKWHPASDQLEGTEEYGAAGSLDAAWSTVFADVAFDNFLFSTGDCKLWLITKKDEIMGGKGGGPYYANKAREILKSSESCGPSTAKWYRRKGSKEDPWISITDHGPAIGAGKIVYGENSFGGSHAKNVLPLHKGADVYIRGGADLQNEMSCPSPCKDLEGGGWQWVRHVPAGNKWHAAVDQLRGTEEYGGEFGTGWSKKFDDIVFDTFLFATGDCELWLIAKKSEVMGPQGGVFYANKAREILKSSESCGPSAAKWYRRSGSKEDPWISITDHGPAIGAGKIVYGENSFAGDHAKNVLPAHMGADVFVRMGGPVSGCPSQCLGLEGGGWQWVRHVPAGQKWHRATDQLAGTEQYGGGELGEEWSKKFDDIDFDTFLFATGDCKLWLIAKKSEVTGGEGEAFYTNSAKNILKSSGNCGPSTAKWYRRRGSKEDPWISITDHGPAIGAGKIVYGENSFGGSHAGNVLPAHMGADVFIRKGGAVSGCPAAAPGWWRRRRPWQFPPRHHLFHPPR